MPFPALVHELYFRFFRRSSIYQIGLYLPNILLQNTVCGHGRTKHRKTPQRTPTFVPSKVIRKGIVAYYDTRPQFRREL